LKPNWEGGKRNEPVANEAREGGKNAMFQRDGQPD